VGATEAVTRGRVIAMGLAGIALATLVATVLVLPRSPAAVAWWFRERPYDLDPSVITDAQFPPKDSLVVTLVPDVVRRRALLRAALRWARDPRPERRWRSRAWLWPVGQYDDPEALEAKRAVIALISDRAVPSDAVDASPQPPRVCDLVLVAVLHNESLEHPSNTRTPRFSDAELGEWRAKLEAEAGAP
jgi:hypothetical protein